VDIVLVLALWLHTVAFVIAWGYYGIMGRFVMPALEQSASEDARPLIVSTIERRALPFVLLTVVIFFITGSYLLVVDERYAGLGNFFDSTWTTLMLVKHVVIIALVAVAAWFDWLVRGLEEEPTAEAKASGLRRARWAAEAATGLGALIALLTVAAQLSS
jgi:uncharacterized membrane protein